MKKAKARNTKAAAALSLRENSLPSDVERSWLDHAFFWIATKGGERKNFAEYPDRLRRHSEALPSDLLGALQLIDGKSTGLLAHVSLMIAGLGLIAPLVVDSEFEKGVLITEIAIYLLIAVGCLRCLAVFQFHEFGDGSARLRAIAFHEVILRRELYGLCNRGAIYLTFAVFTVLPFLYLYKPGN